MLRTAKCQRALQFSHRRLYASGAQGLQPQDDQAGADEQPPSALATVSLMGLGAVGAVAVAALGAYGVFKMASAVAEGTGRSMLAKPSEEPVQPQGRVQP